MTDQIVLNCTLNVSTVPAAEEPRLLYLLIDLKSGEGAQPPQAPVNVAIALDVSESMRLPVLNQEQFEELKKLGQVSQTVSDGVPVWTFKNIPAEIRKRAPSNLEAVQASIAQSTKYLEGGDKVSLVAFADTAEVLLRGLSGSDQRSVMDAVARLDSVKLGDETNIGPGLEAGLNEVRRSRTPEMVSRVLILTDGFTQNPDEVLRLAKEARTAAIGVSTLGIGTEFNEKLLVEVADASHGNAYFARTPQEIPSAFEKELAAVQSVSLRAVAIGVKLSSGVEIRRAYQVRPVISAVREGRRDGRAYGFSMGDLDPANPPALLLELVVPTQSGGTFRVARVTTSYDGSGGGGGGGGSKERVVDAASDVVINYSVSKKRVEPDPVVMNTVERVTAYALQTRALDDMAAGNTAAATQKLRAAATRLLTLGETDLAQAVETEAVRVEQSGQVSPEGAKELRYATRRLTQRL